MEQCRNAVGRMVHQPVLHGSHHVAHHIGVARLLEGILREVADTVRYQFATLRSIQLTLLVEELFHIHALQLGDTLFLRHLLIQRIHLLLNIHVGDRLTACQKCGHARHNESSHLFIK